VRGVYNGNGKFRKTLKGTKGENFNILSLAAGTGIVEKEWLEKGYNVDLQECQEESLMPLKELYPDLNIFICDVRNLPLDNKYDLIFISALEYVLSRKDYFELLGGLLKILCNNGIVFIVCVTNLTFIGIIKGIIKKLLIKPKRGIHCGWKRTIGEHIAVGQRANLNVSAIYSFVGGDTETVKFYKPTFPYNLINNDSYVVGVEMVKRGVKL